MVECAVCVLADDPVTESGLTALLRRSSRLRVVEMSELDVSDVGLVAVDRVDDCSLPRIRAVQRQGHPPVVLVASELDDAAVARVSEYGVIAFVRRADATCSRLEEAVLRARDRLGVLPEDLIAGLLARTSGHTGMGAAETLSDREVEVLRLIADGMDTTEIAHELSYSERTIKGVIHDLTTRFRLRNRSHAVAFAVRRGLI